MKKIIRKRAYDTLECRCVYKWESPDGPCELLQKPGGEYFTATYYTDEDKAKWRTAIRRFRDEKCVPGGCLACCAIDRCHLCTPRQWGESVLDKELFAKEFGEAGDEG